VSEAQVKRIALLAVVLILIFGTHGKASSTVRQADARVNHSLLSSNSGSNFVPIVTQPLPSGTAPQPQPTKHVADLAEALLEMSEPASLLLLGTTLLCFVGITRRLPNYLRAKQIDIKAAWQVVSGFFF